MAFKIGGVDVSTVRVAGVEAKSVRIGTGGGSVEVWSASKYPLSGSGDHVFVESGMFTVTFSANSNTRMNGQLVGWRTSTTVRASAGDVLSTSQNSAWTVEKLATAPALWEQSGSFPAQTVPSNASTYNIGDIAVPSWDANLSCTAIVTWANSSPSTKRVGIQLDSFTSGTGLPVSTVTVTSAMYDFSHFWYVTCPSSNATDRRINSGSWSVQEVAW